MNILDQIQKLLEEDTPQQAIRKLAELLHGCVDVAPIHVQRWVEGGVIGKIESIQAYLEPLLESEEALRKIFWAEVLDTKFELLYRFKCIPKSMQENEGIQGLRKLLIQSFADGLERYKHLVGVLTAISNRTHPNYSARALEIYPSIAQEVLDEYLSR